MDSENQDKAIFVGPWGGPGGDHFDDGSYTGVRQIVLTHGGCIVSIRVRYDRDGTPVWSHVHGGLGPQGGTRSEVNLDFPSEYLTGISGHYGPMPDARPVIRSLTFTSNKKTHGPFGEQEGTPFSLPMRGGKIAGFEGSSGWYLDNIGCYIRQS